MKKLIISVLIAVSLICFSGSVSAASPDEAVMISQQDGLTPLYTTKGIPHGEKMHRRRRKDG